MYCQKCGNTNDTQNSICSNCANQFIDKGGFKYGLIGFFFPIAAIIIYFLLADKEPNLCNSLKIGALVNIIMLILISIPLFGLTFISEMLSI